MNKREWIELVQLVGVIILIITSVFAPVFGIAAYMSNLGCQDFASSNPKIEVEFTVFGGCKFKTPDGYWLNTSSIQYIANDGEITIGE